MSRITCCGNKTLFIDDKNDIWCEAINASYFKPERRIPSGIYAKKEEFSSILQIAGVCVLEGHAVFLRDDGLVFGTGCNEFAQLSGGDAAPLQGSHPVYGLSNIISIATADTHTLAIDDSYSVWGVGLNLGQLGTAGSIKIFSPVKLEGIPQILAVCAGKRHSLFLDFDGKVWYCGSSELGRFVLGVRDESWAKPRILPFENRIVQMSSHGFEAMFLDCTGNVFLASTSGMMKLQLTFTPKQVSSGNYNFILDVEGKLWQVTSSFSVVEIEGLPPLEEIFHVVIGLVGCTEDYQLWDIWIRKENGKENLKLSPKTVPFTLLPHNNDKKIKSARKVL